MKFLALASLGALAVCSTVSTHAPCYDCDYNAPKGDNFVKGRANIVKGRRNNVVGYGNQNYGFLNNVRGRGNNVWGISNDV